MISIRLRDLRTRGKRWSRRVVPWTSPAVWRSSRWARRALREAEDSLKAHGVTARIAPPPPLPASAVHGVLSALHHRDPTCLERALVLQTWHAAHDHPYEIVIGVRRADTEVRAHAWVHGVDATPADYLELHRLSPR
jgi:hypothetical protein